jgi:hypothetical protein
LRRDAHCHRLDLGHCAQHGIEVVEAPNVFELVVWACDRNELESTARPDGGQVLIARDLAEANLTA